MKKAITGALAAVLSLSLVTTSVPVANAAATDGAKAAAGEEITLPKSKGNPISGFDENGNIIYAGDPGVLVDGDTVYLYLGHDNTKGGGTYSMPDWLCYSTTDMENWEYHGVVASADNKDTPADNRYIPWAGGDEAWAGQVMKHRDPELDQDFYYFYYCSNGVKHIGVAVADTPLGWSDTDAKADYCEAKGIKDNNPDSKYFVDIGVPLVQNNVTWPFGHNHDDIDPTAWVEIGEDGKEHRYLAWGNTFCFIAELNEDMISIMDKNGDGLITMKTTRSLQSRTGSVATSYKNGNTIVATTQLVDVPYGYPETVTYKDIQGTSHTIDQGDQFPDGDIICSKFRTYNTYDYEGDTPYTEYGVANDNDGGSMQGLLECDDDYMLNGLYTWMEKDGETVPNYHFFTEAPFLYRRQDENGRPYGKYYLFFAVDWREQLAYATCDDLNEADWQFQDVLLDWNPTGDTRHPSVFDFKGKTYLIDHNGSLPWGFGKRRVAYIEEINFDENGLVLPIQDTATGLTGTTSWITDTAGKNITHEDFLTPRGDGGYPFTPGKKTAKSVSMTATDNDGDSRWEIVAGKADPGNESYVSIESWNRPGLYLQASGTDVVLAQHATDDNSLSTDASVGEAMTFKTVAGLNGTADTVSFESVATPGMYLTSKDDDLSLTDGTDTDACTFTVTNRNALKSITAAKTKTMYKKGEALDTSDITVTATRQGGVTELVSDFTVNTQEINMNTAGTKTLTVTYQEDNFIRQAAVDIIVPEISLPAALSLKTGSSQALKATVTPANLTLEWSTSNANIAKVDQNGNVTGVADGTATITAKAGEASASCTVTVTTDAAPKNPNLSLSLSQTKLSMKAGEKKTLTATISPASASNQTISWSTSNSKVATVKNGTVTANKPGTAEITATVGNAKATCTVTVKKVKAKSVKLNKKKVTIKRGKSVKLKATMKPKNATDSLSWKTSNKKVATVKNGKVTGKAAGKAKITVKTSGGKKAVCNVTVK